MSTRTRSALAFGLPGLARSALAFACLWLALAASPTDAAAQTYAASAGWGGGFISFQPFITQGEHSPQDIGLSSSWVAQATAESWQLDRWVGVRLGGTFSRGALAFPANDRTVTTWGLEAAALLRVVPPVEGRTASAYGIAGGGFMWFNMGAGGASPIAGTAVIYDDQDRRRPMALVGGGIEFMTGMRAMDNDVGIRIEGVNQVTFGGPLTPVDGPKPGAMHNPRISVMLFSGTAGIF
jgi:hypothetical protein